MHYENSSTLNWMVREALKSLSSETQLESIFDSKPSYLIQYESGLKALDLDRQCDLIKLVVGAENPLNPLPIVLTGNGKREGLDIRRSDLKKFKRSKVEISVDFEKVSAQELNVEDQLGKFLELRGRVPINPRDTSKKRAALNELDNQLFKKRDVQKQSRAQIPQKFHINSNLGDNHAELSSLLLSEIRIFNRILPLNSCEPNPNTIIFVWTLNFSRTGLKNVDALLRNLKGRYSKCIIIIESPGEERNQLYGNESEVQWEICYSGCINRTASIIINNLQHDLNLNVQRYTSSVT